MRLRSPPDSSDSFLTFLPLGLASTSMPVLSRSSGCGEHELAGAAGEQRAEQLREVRADVGERGGEHALDLLVDGLDDPGQLAAGVADVLELLLEERVALLQLVELLERQRVDRAEQAQLAIELADPAGGGGALGQRRLLGRLGDLRLDVEVATQRLDRVLEPQLRLGLVDVGAVGPLARLVELAARPRAAPCGRRRGAVVSARTSSLWRRRCSLSASCSTSITCRWAATSAASRSIATSERSIWIAPLGGLRRGPRRRPRGGARSRRCAARGTAGARADRRCAPRARGGATTSTAARASRSARASPRALAASASACSSASSAGSTASSSAIRLALDGDVAGELGDRSARASRARPASSRRSAERPRQRLGGGREAGVVLVELAGELVPRLAARPVERLARRGAARRSATASRWRRASARCLRLGERGRRGTAGGGADAPPARREAIAVAGDDDGAAGGRSRRRRRRRRRRRSTAPPSSASSRPRHAGAVGAHVRAHRLADAGRRAAACRRSPTREHGTAGVGVAERRERPPGGVAAVDHDRRQRLAERGLDRRLPARRRCRRGRAACRARRRRRRVARPRRARGRRRARAAAPRPGRSPREADSAASLAARR